MKFYLLALTMGFSFSSIAQLKYPTTKTEQQVDTYFGTEVSDPYRWLEDDRAKDVMKWVKDQNVVTNNYLGKIPFRKKVLKRLQDLYNYPKYAAPFRSQNKYFFSKNNGLQNQSVMYVQEGLAGKPAVFLDPNKFSKDGTVKMTAFSVSRDGKYVGFGKSKGGSDWQEYYVMEVATKKLLKDKVEWVKVSALSWQGDGFYYSRYPAPEKGKELSTSNDNHQVYYHKVGTPQSQDKLVYEDKVNQKRFHMAFTSEDERFVFLSVSDRGKGKDGNALYYRDLTVKDSEFKPIVSEISDHDYGIVTTDGDKFIVMTDEDAENGKVMSFDPQKNKWKTLIAEKDEPISEVQSSGGKLFVTYMKDVASKTYVYSYEGKLENEVELPGLGLADGFGGWKDDKEAFYIFTSFTHPTSVYRYDIATKTSSVFRQSEAKFEPNNFETKQVFYKSKDGTKVPMFIVHKKGLELTQQNPTLLYGYGGFNVSLQPSFNPLIIAWLEQGGVYAVANLRGGGEYGEKWHQAGMKLNKQNVFDDFIAAAEYLIKEKYTSSQYLAIQGGSNGGLLVGAVINQRPELFKAAIPQVGVMDMLRFHKFTIGWNWIADYGSSEASEAEFKNLYAYSPVHNIKDNLNYPATLVTTADHDDRVVPAHSFKYIATLQAKYKGVNPALIRIAVKSGHGASSTTKRLEETADVYSFLFFNLGVTPKY